MNIAFHKCTFEAVRKRFDLYLSTLTNVVDDYWEEHILNAQLYKIYADETEIGGFAVFNEEKLTWFHMDAVFLFKAQEIFKRILSEYKIQTAYAATCDELMLSLCMDYHKSIEKQAYFFDGSICHKVAPPEYERECIAQVLPEEIGDVNEKTDNFFHDVTPESMRAGAHKIYRLRDCGEDLGYGVLVPMKTIPQYWGCGMVTVEEYRRKGVGRSIQIHLAELCREMGKIPVSGCWYQNHLSKKTIESAGRYSKTRLLNVHF